MADDGCFDGVLPVIEDDGDTKPDDAGVTVIPETGVVKGEGLDPGMEPGVKVSDLYRYSEDYNAVMTAAEVAAVLATVAEMKAADFVDDERWTEAADAGALVPDEGLIGDPTDMEDPCRCAAGIVRAIRSLIVRS
ncbi:hypothetical protein BX616_004127 [Lobosporangium transversale]|nr:hypothetical protein BX616_004127 [Lobosporangium transversale]